MLKAARRWGVPRWRRSRERYQINLEQAAQESQAQMHSALEQLCAREVPGDTYRNLQIYPQYSQQTFKHTLLPVWLLTYQYGSRTFNVVANGYTGSIAGEYPKSVWKILLVVLAAIIAVLVFIALQNQ